MLRKSSLVIATVLIAPLLWALPNIISAERTDGEATVTLRLFTEAITADLRSWCEVRIQATGNDTPFTSGDSVSIWVREDDVALDDLLWETSFTITSEEEATGLVDRTFDCSFDLDDGEEGATWEIYAEAMVDKDTLFFDDHPTTSNLEVSKVDDDAAEDDDSEGTAAVLVLDAVLERIARDDDWFRFTLTEPAELEARLTFRPDCGRLDAALYPTGGSSVGAADEDDGASITTGLIGAGIHTILVAPRDSGDFNFYDITVSATVPIFSNGFESGTISGWSAMSCNNDPAPPGGSCPAQCTGGCPGNVCIIDCSSPSSCEQMTIDCPPGFACDVQCTGDSSCAEAAVNCPGNFSCSVSCDSVDSCSQATITCPVSAPCDLLCSGPPSSCSATLQVCGLGNCQATCTGGQSVTTDCGAACSCSRCP